MELIKGVNGEDIFDMGRDAGQLSLNSMFATDVFKYSLNYFVGDYQAVGATNHLMDKGTNNHY